MWSPLTETLFLGGAGTLAGMAGSAGAIGSLISYPALLAVGIPALPANITQSVAVVGLGIGGSVGSRPELRGARSQLRGWVALTVAGTVAGVALLLLSPGGFFRWLVPFLIAAASVLLLLQPRIYRWQQTRPGGGHRAALPYGLFAVAVYNGYFGAASGVMTLAVLMLTVETRITRANALKNVLLAIGDVIAATAFILFAHIHWGAAIPLGVGFLAGGLLGPAVARRTPEALLRKVIGAAGIVLASWLLIDAARG